MPPQQVQSFWPVLHIGDVVIGLLALALATWFLIGLAIRLTFIIFGRRRKPTHDLITTLSDWCSWLREAGLETIGARPPLLEVLRSGLAILSLVFLVPAAIGATYANLQLISPIVGFIFNVPNSLAHIIAVVFIVAELVAGIVLCHTYPPLANTLRHAASRTVSFRRGPRQPEKLSEHLPGQEVQASKSQLRMAQVMLSVLVVLMLFESVGNGYAVLVATEDPLAALLGGLIGLGWPAANVTAVSVAAEAIVIPVVQWFIYVLVGVLGLILYALLRWWVPVVIPSRAALLAYRATEWLTSAQQHDQKASGAA